MSFQHILTANEKVYWLNAISFMESLCVYLNSLCVEWIWYESFESILFINCTVSWVLSANVLFLLYWRFWFLWHFKTPADTAHLQFMNLGKKNLKERTIPASCYCIGGANKTLHTHKFCFNTIQLLLRSFKVIDHMTIPHNKDD